MHVSISPSNACSNAGPDEARKKNEASNKKGHLYKIFKDKLDSLNNGNVDAKQLNQMKIDVKTSHERYIKMTKSFWWNVLCFLQTLILTDKTTDKSREFRAQQEAELYQKLTEAICHKLVELEIAELRQQIDFTITNPTLDNEKKVNQALEDCEKQLGSIKDDEKKKAYRTQITALFERFAKFKIAELTEQIDLIITNPTLDSERKANLAIKINQTREACEKLIESLNDDEKKKAYKTKIADLLEGFAKLKVIDTSITELAQQIDFAIKNLTSVNVTKVKQALEVCERQLVLILGNVEKQNAYRGQIAGLLERFTNPENWTMPEIEPTKWVVLPNKIPKLLKHLEAHILNETTFAAKLGALVEKKYGINENETFFEALYSANKISELEKESLSQGWQAMFDLAKGMSGHASRLENDIQEITQLCSENKADGKKKTDSEMEADFVTAQIRVQNVLTRFMSCFQPDYRSKDDQDPLKDNHFHLYTDALQHFIVSTDSFNKVLHAAKANHQSNNKPFQDFKDKNRFETLYGKVKLDVDSVTMAPVQRSLQLFLWLGEMAEKCASTPEQVELFTHYLQFKTKRSNLNAPLPGRI